MKHLHSLVILAALAAASCSSDDDTDTQTGSLRGALGRSNRPAPAAADRIDRAGRPAISAALISTFNPDARVADLDRFNRNGNDPEFRGIMATSLAILDGLDGTCGNQLLFNGELENPYGPLAGALADDQLYVQSDREGAGSAYLGVEAEAIGAVMPGQGSGGGRVPNDDVVERSYSVLVAGALGGIDDGVGSDDAEHDIDVFPFLAEPQ